MKRVCLILVDLLMMESKSSMSEKRGRAGWNGKLMKRANNFPAAYHWFPTKYSRSIFRNFIKINSRSCLNNSDENRFINS